MNSRERRIIYSLLAVLAVAQAAILFNTSTGQQAWAHARAIFEDVGPATAVRLVDEEDSSAKEVVLRNDGGQFRFGESAHSTAYSVGFVHVGKALSPLLDSETMQEARESLDEELTAKDEDLRSRMQAFEEENRDVKPDSPNFEEVRERYRVLLEEVQQWQMEKMGRRDKLIAEQVEQAYRDVVAAVDVVAESNGVDVVYRFVPTDDEFQATSPAAAYESIRARVVIKYPEGLDLTDQVLEELDLEVE